MTTATLPKEYIAWELFGAGFEHVGREGQPSRLPLRPPRENEILLRVDATGICLSDIKIIKQGGAHARLRGRDLAKDPVVLGHECSATVVAVGDRWKGRFHPGERYIIQADIYYKGEGVAFGYLLRGGMAQYTYLDERAIEGDEGCYLIPVRPETGHSQAALTEPWACVEMSYNLSDRLQPGNGRMLVITEEAAAWKDRFPRAIISGPALDNLPQEGAFDDIIVCAPRAGVVNALADRLAPKGVMFLLGTPAEDGAITLDVGAIHYQDKRYFGGADTLEGIASRHGRNDLLPRGAALFIGAGGPMGQMHVQRAIEMPDGPRIVVATDLDRGRLDHLLRRFGPMATAKGIAFHTLAPADFADPTAMDARIAALAPGGYTDIAIMVPVAALVPQYLRCAADGAFVNIFAGVGIGSHAAFQLRDLCRGIKLIGSSGSRIADMRKVLDKVERGELNTNLSVAAIGGLNAAKDGLEAVRDAKFPGKTVLYTQILDLPLTPLDALAARLPDVAAKLSPEGAWTIEAERALLEHFGDGRA